MGRRNGQRKNIVMLDSDDDENSSVNSSATIISDSMSMLETQEVQLDKKCVLEQALDDLYEKRGSTREKALANIIDAFNRNMEHEFVEKRFATLLHQCLNCIKKGSSEEIALASHAVGLLALTVGSGDKACEILQKSVTPILQALNSGSESKKTVSLLECLAVVTFVGGNEPADTERSLQIMWKLVHPKLGSKVVAVEPSAPVIAAVLSAWAFLLTTVDGWTLDPKNWQESISYLSGLLDKYERLTRIAAGEALAVIFEMGCLEKIAAKAKGYTDSTVQEGEELKAKILNQIRNLSAEAGGKGSTKKDLNSQHKLFKNILEFLESGNCPETSMKIGGDSLQTTTWSQLIQLNFLKHFLGSGFLRNTPLLESVKGGHDEVGSALVRAGATLEIDDAGGFLCMAVARRDLGLLKRALANGMNPNAKNFDCRTPLHVAASEGLYPMAKLLLEAGASVFSKDRWGNTPLDEARLGGNKNFINLFETARTSQISELSDCHGGIQVAEKQRRKCTVYPFHPWDPTEKRREGVVLWVPETMEEIVKAAMEQLNCTSRCILSENGGKIIDVNMINDNQKLFLVSES